MKRNSKQKKILVTGGAGYLGSNLVPMLLDQGYQVHVLDRCYFGSDSLKKYLNHPSLHLTNEDILYHENIPHLFKDIDAVMHLASISNDPSCDLDPNLTIQTNFLATMSLARRAQAEGVKHFIFMSSCSVYGASGNRYLDEKSTVGPVTLYALTKLQCERELVRMVSKKFTVTILRMATLFGGSERMRFDLAINAMTKRALQGKNIIVNGDGKQYRPFIHVKDAARALIEVLKNKKLSDKRQVYNVGSEKLNYSIADLAKEVQQQFPSIQLEHIADNNDIRSYRVRFKRFQKQFGFSLLYSAVDGIREIRETYHSGVWPNMDDDKFYNVLVMKKSVQGPILSHSLASAPRWNSKQPLLRSK